MQESQSPFAGNHTITLGPAEITAVFDTLCDEFGKVEQTRQAMLQYVFTATSFLGTASVFAGVIAKSSLFDHFLTVVGVLGMFATFALFFREARLNSEMNRLIKQGQLYEQMMQIPSTMFSQDRWGELSTLLIYSGAVSGWFCVGTWFVLTPGFSLILAFPVFLITYLLKRLIRNRILSGSVS